MAGSNPGFDGNAFREGIRFVQQMAAAPIDSDQVSFYKPAQLVYNRPTDPENVPFDPNATVTRVQPAPVKVACGLEYRTAKGEVTAFGSITASRLVVTLLDEEYELVKDCSYIVVAGEKWNYLLTEPPTGLFDVGLFSMHFVAEDDR